MLTKDRNLNKHTLAQNLLNFLSQKEDFETQIVLKRLSQTKSYPKTQHLVLQTGSTPIIAPHQPLQLVRNQEPITQTKQPPSPSYPSESIYKRMVEKIKKSCPELKIKPPLEHTSSSLPEAKVLFLNQNSMPQLYQALAEAIDKQLGVTEIVMIDHIVIKELLTKPYELILIPKTLKQSPYFKENLKSTAHPPYYRLGPSAVILIDDPDTLQNPSNKKQLWQMIKTLLA